MRLIYRFFLNDRVVNPTYKDDLSKEYEQESSQQFFRAKLSGKIAFIKDDYDWLNEQDFSTEFILTIEESFDGGNTWNEFFKGKFMKTDCTWNDDDKKCEVQPDVYDQYNDVIAGLDKEYDIIPLSPEMQSLTIMKRPLIQVYIPGDSVVSCFIGGTYWEQEVINETDDVEQLKKYHFALASELREVTLTANNASVADIAGLYAGKNGMYRKKGGGYYIKYEYGENLGARIETFTIYEESTDKALYFSLNITQGNTSNGDLTFNPVDGSGVSGKPTGTTKKYDVYMRYLLDKEKIYDTSTYPIPTEDILDDNRNYKRCIGYNVDLAQITYNYSEEPTQYGRTNDGNYFAPPFTSFGEKFYPISKSSWNWASIWFAFHLADVMYEQEGRTPYVLKDAYKLSSVINVLLEQFSDVRHEASVEYSQFLYGDVNPITNEKFTLLITPKSNVLHGNYDQPAQKAETTLNTILNALRDIYCCYWYIEDKKLKIEHISFFKNGGTYDINPQVGVDLTVLENPTNRKKWGYLTSNYEFDKSDMPERYQFSWMDDVTKAFSGYPIEIRSKYVSPGRIEDITVSSITTDIDYMMLNPNAISQDGFALFAAVYEDGTYRLPFVERNIDGADLRLQNGYLSWVTLHPNYYVYDLPAKEVVINDEIRYLGRTNRKKKQKVKFPLLSDIDTNKLIKTYLGDGQIEKISVNLSSRMNQITLRYDTE